MLNKNTIDYSKEDLVEYYVQLILKQWIKDHHPEIIQKAREIVIFELRNK